MEGNTNNEYMIGKRATMAVNRINEQRGWIQSMTKREWNIDEITNACIVALKSMDSFDFNTYEAKLRAKGYSIKVMRDSIGKVCGYSVKKGNSTYKSSELGHSRSLTPSRLRTTWEKLLFNWQLGRDLVQKKAEERWGAGVVEQVSLDLRREFPNEDGFSARNLRYMKQWYLFYTTEAAKLQRPVAEIMHQVGAEIKNIKIVSKLTSMSIRGRSLIIFQRTF
jgi:hypothetical protein